MSQLLSREYGKRTTLSCYNQLAQFKDSVSSWASSAAAVCIKNGIVNGSNQMIHPTKDITRAETAAMAKRMLDKAGLI